MLSSGNLGLGKLSEVDGLGRNWVSRYKLLTCEDGMNGGSSVDTDWTNRTISDENWNLTPCGATNGRSAVFSVMDGGIETS